jgi:hypothetical protein
MTLKDISNVISTSTDIIICQRIEYDNAKLPMKSKTLSYDEFMWVVEKSDRFAHMLVEDIFSKDNNLYICIY